MNKIIMTACVALLAVLLTSCNKKEKTSPVRKNIQEAVFASGNLEQEDEYIISSKVNGMIRSVNVKEGDEVLASAIIGTIDNDVQTAQYQDAQSVYSDAQRNASTASPQLTQIKLQIEQARQQLELDKTNFQRYSDLRSKNSVSQLDFDKAKLQYENSQDNLCALEQKYTETKDALNLSSQRSQLQVNAQKATLNDYNITALSAGRVVNVFKKKGELVRIGDPIAKIGSGAFVIKLFVSEDDITKVTVGQYVAVHLNTYPDKNFEAKVTKIYPGFDTGEQSYVVEAAFETAPIALFSGTQLQADIKTANRTNVLVIPTAYLVKDNYVVLEDGSQKEVVVGNRDNDWAEIVSGITEKEVIVKTKSKKK